MVVYRSIGVGGLEFELSPLNFHFKKVKKISHVGSYFFFWGGGGGGRQGWGDGGLGVLQHQVHLIQEKN